jgi:outer membrane receptor protein involved in Fe transport
MTGVDYLDTSNIRESRADAWQEVNAWVTLLEREDRWSVSLWGRNLTDEVRPTRFFNVLTNPLVGQQLIALNAPRTYGIRARLKF